MKLRCKGIAILVLSAAICWLPVCSDADDLNQKIQNMLTEFEQQIKTAGKDQTDFIVVRSFYDEVAGKSSRRSEEIRERIYQIVSNKYLGKTKIVIFNWKSEKPLGKNIASKSDETVHKQGVLEKRLNEKFGNGFLITGTITAADESDIVNAELIDMKSGSVLMRSKTAVPSAAKEPVLVKNTIPFGQAGGKEVESVPQNTPSEQTAGKKAIPLQKIKPSGQADVAKVGSVKKSQAARQVVAVVDAPPSIKTESLKIKTASVAAEKDISYKVVKGVNFKYEGQIKNGKKHGRGTLTFDSGDKYVGQWRNDKKHGQGSYLFAGGDKYVGQWKDNKMNGQGTYFFNSGNKYVGQWRNDKKHGHGTYYYKNGDKWEGTYVNNKKHGYGIYTWAGGQSSKEFWQDGKLVE